jgi:hypothetical protein
MEAVLERQVRSRAKDTCEYCQVSVFLYDQPFHIDHIIAQKHHGQTIAENLAFSCLDCNLHKGSNIAGLDPLTAKLTRLFNPRSDRWNDHFAWSGATMIGLTDIGRTTIDVLEINQPIRVRARRIFIDEGSFPTRR